jgi:hypothetical protein
LEHPEADAEVECCVSHYLDIFIFIFHLIKAIAPLAITMLSFQVDPSFLSLFSLRTSSPEKKLKAQIIFSHGTPPTVLRGRLNALI